MCVAGGAGEGGAYSIQEECVNVFPRWGGGGCIFYTGGMCECVPKGSSKETNNFNSVASAESANISFQETVTIYIYNNKQMNEYTFRRESIKSCCQPPPPLKRKEFGSKFNPLRVDPLMCRKANGKSPKLSPF